MKRNRSPINGIPAKDETVMEDRFLNHFLPGDSEWIRETRRQICRLNSPVNRELVRTILVLGETGAGKSYIARVIAAHSCWLKIRNSELDLGPEAGLTPYTGKFAEINLPGVPDQLVESELFGYKKGAFTSAVSDHIGYFGQDLDDILLDEIGDVSPALQAKLLGVLETRHFLLLGGTKLDEQELQPRVIVATNRNLQDMVKKGTFRLDLLWRLSMFTLRAPLLRQQADNISDIIDRIQDGLDIESSKSGAVGSPRRRLSSKEVSWARTYSWPGNIRQLSHSIRIWRFYEGNKDFALIAGELESQAHVDMKGRSLVEEYVFGRLGDVQERKEKKFQNPTDVVNETTEAAKKAVVSWSDRVKGDSEALSRVFSNNNIRSVQNRISTWRGKE